MFKNLRMLALLSNPKTSLKRISKKGKKRKKNKKLEKIESKKKKKRNNIIIEKIRHFPMKWAIEDPLTSVWIPRPQTVPMWCQ